MLVQIKWLNKVKAVISMSLLAPVWLLQLPSSDSYLGGRMGKRRTPRYLSLSAGKQTFKKLYQSSTQNSLVRKVSSFPRFSKKIPENKAFARQLDILNEIQVLLVMKKEGKMDLGQTTILIIYCYYTKLLQTQQLKKTYIGWGGRFTVVSVENYTRIKK